MEIVLNKRNVSLIVIAVVLLALIGFSFAYFVGGVGTPAITDTSITGEKESRLQFTPGTPINLVASLDNFADGSGSLSGETTSTATLTSSSTQEVVSDEYNVYYNISENNYVYTQNSSTPELILEVFDNEGNEITSLEGLTYVTTTDALTGETINGFDVTTYTGLIPIKDNMPISATHPDNTTHEWNIKLTFINLDADQTLNEGKTFTGDLVLTQGYLFYDKVIADNGGISSIESKSEPDFSSVTTTNEGMFSTQDDYGTSYYYRGAVDNNWVSFAGFYWRIVRINGDGSVRIIYSGETAPIESQKVVMTGSNNYIGSSVYHNSVSSIEYLGYMYTPGERHGNSTSNSTKLTVDNWYSANLLNYSEYISDSIFCNDRSTYTSSGGETALTGIGSSTYYYGSYVRIITLNSPSLECPLKSDAFTVDDDINGTGVLTYPIGLLTADEAAFAGGHDGENNTAFYLNTGSHYWNMSPNIYVGHVYYNYAVYNNGYVGGMPISNTYGIRPVISLKSVTSVSGSGTWNDPYVVE